MTSSVERSRSRRVPTSTGRSRRQRLQRPPSSTRSIRRSRRTCTRTSTATTRRANLPTSTRSVPARAVAGPADLVAAVDVQHDGERTSLTVDLRRPELANLHAARLVPGRYGSAGVARRGVTGSSTFNNLAGGSPNSSRSTAPRSRDDATSARTMSPTTIAAGGDTETVHVSITPRDSRYEQVAPGGDDGRQFRVLRIEHLERRLADGQWRRPVGREDRQSRRMHTATSHITTLSSGRPTR